MKHSKHGPVVLMYHGVVQPPSIFPDDREQGAELYDVPLESFEQQMQWLSANDIPTGISHEKGSERPAVVLTFDDGERNNIEFGWPVLKRFGFPAFFFVTVKRIGKKGYMNWEDLKELRDGGMTLGSHGLTHRILTGLKRKELEKELAESKSILERELKVRIKDFSVPRGFYNSRLLKTAKDVGYERIFVSETYFSRDPVIARRAVRGHWSLDRFVLTVKGKTPVPETMLKACKDSAKKILGHHRYSNVRNLLLKLRK